jgi:ubiquinone/menaquinone biosynthesis C-methylase UbiE
MPTDAHVASPSDEASFTGERFLPRCSGEIAYEHWHRYAFARSLASGKAVVDAASGEGYGAALLSSVAARVYGVDIDAETVERATRKYASIGNLSFVRASCAALPFPDRSFDLIVSFETIEHIDAAAQTRMLEEFDRLLAPDGLVVLSSPNKAEYSDARGTHNEFHVHELYRDELANLLALHFSATRWFSQRVQWWSGIWSGEPLLGPVEAFCVDESSIEGYHAPEALYYGVIAARSEGPLSATIPRGSILTDRNDSVTKRYESAVGHLIEQYKLVDELSAGADRQMGHVQHLEGLVREHDEEIARQEARAQQLEALISEKDRLIKAVREEAATLQGDIDRLRSVNFERHSTIGHLEKQVTQLAEAARRAYSWRWWLRFPFVRARGERPPV